MKHIRDIMSSPVFTVDEDASIQDAAEILREKNIGCVVVLKDNKLKGILTERDITKKIVATNKLPSQIKVREVMRSPVVTIDPKTPIYKASIIMLKGGFRRLPVVEKGKVIGIVTETDIEKALMEYAIEEQDESLAELGEVADRIYEMCLKHACKVSVMKNTLNKDEKLILMAIGWLAREDKIVYLDVSGEDIIIKTKR